MGRAVACPRGTCTTNQRARLSTLIRQSCEGGRDIPPTRDNRARGGVLEVDSLELLEGDDALLLDPPKQQHRQ
eukprot:412597-Prorocentrum_minimum.AAC.1